MSHRPKHIVEYLLLRVIAGVLRTLPHAGALCAGCGLAAFAHFVLRFRKREAMARIREVFGDRYTEKQMRRIAWISFRNIVFNGVEALRLDRYGERWIESCFDCREALETMRAHTGPGQGMVLVLTHTGNWDLGSRVCERGAIPAVYIARNQSNPLTYGYFDRIRNKAGIQIEDRDDPALVRKVIRHINDGSMLGVMVDLRAKNPTPQLRFLGKEADIAAGPGLIARKSKAIVFPMTIVREGWFKHRWIMRESIQTDPQLSGREDRHRIMQHCLDQLSPFILEHPEQYFWYNKRWVLEPFPNRDPEKKLTPSSSTTKGLTNE